MRDQEMEAEHSFRMIIELEYHSSLTKYLQRERTPNNYSPPNTTISFSVVRKIVNRRQIIMRN